MPHQIMLINNLSPPAPSWTDLEQARAKPPPPPSRGGNYTYTLKKGF